MTDVYLSLGSNLGDRHTLLLRAIDLLARRAGRLVRASSIIETEPWGYTSPNPFLNVVVLIRTSLSPHELLAETQAIERELGRTSKTPSSPLRLKALTASTNSDATVPEGSLPYSDRPIDIDLLLYGDLRLSTPELTIPHPRMFQRDFVMRPLRELLPADSPLFAQ